MRKTTGDQPEPLLDRKKTVGPKRAVYTLDANSLFPKGVEDFLGPLGSYLYK